MSSIKIRTCEFCHNVCSAPCETENNAKKCSRYLNKHIHAIIDFFMGLW